MVASGALIAALLAPAQGVTTRAAGFPETATTDEVAIVDTQQAPVAARTRGSWSWTAAGVSMVRPHAFGDSYWFPINPAAVLGDGAVRAVVRFGAHVDTTIMFRCHLPAGDLERLSGYGLAIERGAVRFLRWEDGLPRSLGTAVNVRGLGNRSGVEVLVMLAGPLMTALVYDIDSLEPIASLTMTDTRFAGGAVGLRAFRRQDPQTHLVRLTTLRAAIERRDDRAALGGARVIRLPGSVEDRLPAAVRAKIVAREEDELVLNAGRLDLAWLHRAGIEPLAIADRIPWKYIDPDYYFAQAYGPVSTAEGFVVDASYKDADMVESLLAAYHQRFPDLTRLEALGPTAGGRTLWALKISDHANDDEPEPAILLEAAHHGLELLSTEFVIDAVQLLLERYDADPWVRRWVDSLEIWCVPLVNPDGRQFFMQESVQAGRKNHRDVDGDGIVGPHEGVDLNRNYPFRWGALDEAGSRDWPEHAYFRGPAPASEPETRAMMALAERERFVAAISYHTHGTVILSPYATDGVKNPEGDEAWGVAEFVAASAPMQPNHKRYHVRRKIYSVDGVFKDWLRHEFGTVALLIEGPYHNPRSAQRRRLSVELSRPTWMAMLNRFLDGPSISGRITDAGGAPLAAEVGIAEIRPQESERWTSRPRDGTYGRFLPGPGLFTVSVAMPGYAPQQRRVLVEERLTHVDFVLRRMSARGAKDRRIELSSPLP